MKIYLALVSSLRVYRKITGEVGTAKKVPSRVAAGAHVVGGSLSQYFLNNVMIPKLTLSQFFNIYIYMQNHKSQLKNIIKIYKCLHYSLSCSITPCHILLLPHSLASTSPSIVLSDLHCSSGGHLQDRRSGGARSRGSSPQQYAGVWHHCSELHGPGGVRGSQICEQAGVGLPSVCHPLHSGCLRWSNQDRHRPPCLSVSGLFIH